MWKYFLVRADCEANASANNSSSNQVDQMSALKKLNNNIHGNSSRINTSNTIRNSSPSYRPDTMVMTKNQLLSRNRQMIFANKGHIGQTYVHRLLRCCMASTTQDLYILIRHYPFIYRPHELSTWRVRVSLLSTSTLMMKGSSSVLFSSHLRNVDQLIGIFLFAFTSLLTPKPRIDRLPDFKLSLKYLSKTKSNRLADLIWWSIYGRFIRPEISRMV